MKERKKVKIERPERWLSSKEHLLFFQGTKVRISISTTACNLSSTGSDALCRHLHSRIHKHASMHAHTHVGVYMHTHN